MKLFKLKENNVDIKTEFFASLTVFLIVISSISIIAGLMNSIGIPLGTAFFTLFLSSAVICIIASFFTKIPLAYGVGTSLNYILIIFLVGYLGLSWSGALALVFIVSILFLLIFISPLYNIFVDFIPNEIKLVTPIGIAFFLLYVNLKNCGFIVIESTVFALGDMLQPLSILILFAIFLIIFLYAKKIKQSLLIGMIITIFIGIFFSFFGINFLNYTIPENIIFNSMDFSLFGSFLGGFNEVLGIPIFKLLLIITSILLVWIVDLSSCIFAVLNFTDDGLKPTKRTISRNDYLVLGFSSLIGSILGVSFITPYFESVSASIAGAKTSLMTLFLGILFIVGFFFYPIIFYFINISAIAGIIIMCIVLMQQFKYVDLNDFSQTAPLFIMILVSIISSSIAIGIIFTILSYFIISLSNGKWNEFKLSDFIIYFLFIIILIDYFVF